MKRAILIIAVLIGAAGSARPSQAVYPPLTRETFVGVWEGLFNFDSTYTILHIDVAPEDGESYLVEITAGQRGGGIFRLRSCTIGDAKITLEFRASDGREWWIEGEGYGDAEDGIIRANFGTGFDAKRSGPPYSLCFGRGAWTRSLAEASLKAAEIVAEARREGK